MTTRDPGEIQTVFEPTLREFANFKSYMSKIEEQCFDVGYAIIKAPPEWREQLHPLDTLPSNLSFSPIVQQFSKLKHPGAYVVRAVTPTKIDQWKKIWWSARSKKREITITEYLKYLEDQGLDEAPQKNIDDLENLYWKNLQSGLAVYAADIDFSFCNDEMKIWNFNNLPGLLQRIKDSNDNEILGIHKPFTYLGSWRSSFAFHTEDWDLASINYHVSGAPKVWYIIPRKNGLEFHEASRSVIQSGFEECNNINRHKIGIFSPDFFKEHNIERIRIVQQPGDFVITFPSIYHGGWNAGLNCNMAVNFAMPSWVKYGREAEHCSCSMKSNFKVDLQIDEVVRTILRDRVDAYGVRGHPDDEHVKLQRSQKREEIMMRNMERMQDFKRKQNAEARLDKKILILFAKFVLKTGRPPFSHLTIRNFKIQHPPRSIGLPPMTESCLRQKFERYLFEPIRKRTDNFELSETDFEVLLSKIKKIPRKGSSCN